METMQEPEITAQETELDRLLQFVNHLGITRKEFTNRCGLPIGFLSFPKKRISNRNRSKITLHFPELNMEWLRTGRGTMLHQVKLTDPAQVKKAVVEDLKAQHLSHYAIGEIIGFSRNTIANMLSNGQYFSLKQAVLFSLAFGYNRDFLMTGKGELLDKNGLNLKRLASAKPDLLTETERTGFQKFLALRDEHIAELEQENITLRHIIDTLKNTMQYIV